MWLKPSQELLTETNPEQRFTAGIRYTWNSLSSPKCLIFHFYSSLELYYTVWNLFFVSLVTFLVVVIKIQLFVFLHTYIVPIWTMKHIFNMLLRHYMKNEAEINQTCSKAEQKYNSWKPIWKISGKFYSDGKFQIKE